MKQLIKPGKMLRNGAIVITHTKDYVLAVWDKGNTAGYEYVSWALSVDGDTCWGHYYGDDFTDAVKSFQDRVEGRCAIVPM